MNSDAAGLLDTSVFIAREVEWPLAELPERVAVSVVTLGELHLGVLSAHDATSAPGAATPWPSPGPRTRCLSASR